MKCTVPGVTISSATGVELTLPTIHNILGLLVNSMETAQWLIIIKAMKKKAIEYLDLVSISGMLPQTKYTVVMFNMHNSVKSKH